MCINTTINIKPLLMEKIQEISSTYNISMSKIIALLIIKIMHKKNLKACMFSSVKYQEKDKSIKWQKLHVSYSEDIYEVANDLRKMLKRSVSRIVAEGCGEFLEEIVRDLCKNKNNPDNYHSDYLITLKKHEKIYYFTIFWGIPDIKNLKNYIT